ncbi:hypothetical protein OE88DRAFT_1652250 [Heliocybe sulcata]|uniref:Protein FAF1 n=1 Tax=Heliocybe sulcata TaxID=5364 RepID=A0A5C3ND57_9AGAM|nr:hypothetical protein OE88DRAFT_1652250 [Heliocybe sulcata]
MADQDQAEHLLQLLQAHGQAFLGSFDLPSPRPTKRRRTGDDYSGDRDVTEAPKPEDNVGSEEEWTGFANKSSYVGDSDEDRLESDYGSISADFEENDDGFTAQSSSSRPATVVVFDGAQKRADSMPSSSKTEMKAFMSSKVSKVTQESNNSQRNAGRTVDVEDEDRTNAENDAELRRLIHTKLLSGSLNPELDMKPAQRRKALEGRVMELAGEVKLGKGERSVKSAERNKAAQKVRIGMLAKQKDREGKHLEEAKNLGNYHPTIKKLFEPSDGQRSIRKREKGLTMGIGKFKSGVLKLSKEEISSIQGSSPPSRGMHRGRGRGRGRPGGRRK